jgi:hypothetical protein
VTGALGAPISAAVEGLDEAELARELEALELEVAGTGAAPTVASPAPAPATPDLLADQLPDISKLSLGGPHEPASVDAKAPGGGKPEALRGRVPA